MSVFRRLRGSDGLAGKVWGMILVFCVLLFAVRTRLAGEPFVYRNKRVGFSLEVPTDWHVYEWLEPLPADVFRLGLLSREPDGTGSLTIQPQSVMSSQSAPDVMLMALAARIQAGNVALGKDSRAREGGPKLKTIGTREMVCLTGDYKSGGENRVLFQAGMFAGGQEVVLRFESP